MGYHIPKDWQPDEETQAVIGSAASRGVDTDAEMGKLLAYPFNEPVRYPDKLARGWFDRATERAKPKPQQVATMSRRQSAMERNLAKIDAFKAEHPGDFALLEKYLARHRWWAGASRDFQLEQLCQVIDQKDLILGGFAFQGDA